jgi:hypothetical protein
VLGLVMWVVDRVRGAARTGAGRDAAA